MRPVVLFAATSAVAVAAFAVFKADQLLGVAAGYKAKIACSEIFVAGRNADDVLAAEFNDISPIVSRMTLKVDADRKSVSGSTFGLGPARAVYRDHYGCTLARGTLDSAPPLAPIVDKPLADARAGAPGLRGDIDYAALDAVVEAAFTDDAAATRAILVVKDGAIIAERYADGFSAKTPFLSWSMAKSVTATMVGAAMLRGFVDINSPVLVPEWGADDARQGITWNDLLQMQSGLAFNETYNDPASDVSRMLFRARDAGAVAARKELIHPPGEFWDYSSGTTNLIQRSLRDVLEANDTGYHGFAHNVIFGPIGAPSFVMEPDASGTFIGSSFIYATARDWAKLGLLYLDDGVVDGLRILPDGWSRYVADKADASDGFYGAQFWLNHPGSDGREKYIPGVPDDAYLMAGHEGQYVLIIPDKNMVIVRTGLTRGSAAMPVVAPVFASIYAATP